MCDGAGGHDWIKFNKFSKEELEERKESNYIPKV